MKKTTMNKDNNTQQIPQTGRIGRFANIVKAKTDSETFLRVMVDSPAYGKYKPGEKALWWKNAIERLENELGPSNAIEVMKSCGGKCCGSGQRKTAKRLMQESSSVEDFLDKVSHYEVKEGELEYLLVDEHTIIGKHNRCFCGQVKKMQENFKNDIYCQCSVAFNKHFFEAAFDTEVEVKLLESILTGGDFCKFEIKIKPTE
ncbi:MAG: DUF6144 family protein [Bacteroidales bacterium]|nr:DUF6144 family protein [Bacteroidales bacterium]